MTYRMIMFKEHGGAKAITNEDHPQNVQLSDTDAWNAIMSCGMKRVETDSCMWEDRNQWEMATAPI